MQFKIYEIYRNLQYKGNLFLKQRFELSRI